jgi:hypothetical protein
LPFAVQNSELLLGLGSIYRANVSAGTALNTGVGIDHISFLALRNAGDGAFSLAGPTGDALLANDISHIIMSSLSMHDETNTTLLF